MGKPADDPRIDPRIKAFMGETPDGPLPKNVDSREAMIAAANTDEAKARREQTTKFMDLSDREDIAPSAGISIRTEQLTSDPDGNTINIQYIRPDSDDLLPCVYYIHGGAMASM